MRVFDKETKSCSTCDFGDLEFESCKYENISFKKDFWNKGINKNCPFNKPLTKEDIESFGFKEIAKNYFKLIKINSLFPELKKEYFTIFLEIKHNSIFKLTGIIDVENIKITSKPHLKFILQSLNII